jgi:electron transport complex protein RnfG
LKKQAWLILLIITVAAGFALSLTNMVTKAPIEQQQQLSRNAARIAVFSGADDFQELTVTEGSKIDSVFAALQNGVTVGYVMQVTVSGYGGPIEIVMGVDESGTITGISVGGSSFAETAGLGTRTRDPEFTDQFIGLAAAPELNVNIDAISGATISSRAVTTGALLCYRYWQALHGIIIEDADTTTGATTYAPTATGTDATSSATSGGAAATAPPASGTDGTSSATLGGAAATAPPASGTDGTSSATLGGAAATAPPASGTDGTSSATSGGATVTAKPSTAIDATSSATSGGATATTPPATVTDGTSSATSGGRGGTSAPGTNTYSEEEDDWGDEDDEG